MKWEYCHRHLIKETTESVGFWQERIHGEIDVEEMEKLGNEGWELVSFYKQIGFFKRPKSKRKKL